MKKQRLPGLLTGMLLCMVFLVSSCSSPAQTPEVIQPASSPTSHPTLEPTPIPTTAVKLPAIFAVQLERADLARYETLEMAAELEAEFANPYDAREISLDGVFTAPDGTQIRVPGFWDGEAAWRMRFTPSQVGEWRYELRVTDLNGISEPVEGVFNVTPSDLHGWLQVGSWQNLEFSSRYLVLKDGTPFYGVGHADALNILVDGFSVEDGVGLFNAMLAAGENYVVWWPFYSYSPVKTRYDDYTVSNLKLIDTVVQDAQKKGIFLVFTIWDHPQLRDKSHSWADGRWESYNGFSKLSNIEEFFTSEEAWTWQENLYRYIIARWGYSPAIGLWQTVSEVNGTNAYEHTDAWHSQVNAYFVENDPYRHPTTASKSGETAWPEGWAVMDVPQVHVYANIDGAGDDAVKAASTMAYWSELMWDQQAKPNWVGEFGVKDNSLYPEVFHNSIWAALGAGAAMTPAEWNSGGAFGEMTPEMYADSARLRKFVDSIPLAAWDPSSLQITGPAPEVHAWGVAGEAGGLIWIQDASQEGKPIGEVRSAQTVRQGVVLEVQGLAQGTYSIQTYDTWAGEFSPGFEVVCMDGEPCVIAIPDFLADIAIKLERKGV